RGGGIFANWGSRSAPRCSLRLLFLGFGLRLKCVSLCGEGDSRRFCISPGLPQLQRLIVQLRPLVVAVNYTLCFWRSSGIHGRTVSDAGGRLVFFHQFFDLTLSIATGKG